MGRLSLNDVTYLGNPVNVSVECIECNETLFSMDAPAGQEGGEEEDPYPYQEPDGEDESA